MVCILTWANIGLGLGFSASLPKVTQQMLKKLKLDSSIMAGVDKELDLPRGWIEKAKKEGTLKVRGNPVMTKDLNVLMAPFRERYPFIKINYFGANRQSRTIKTLLAYRSGRVLADMVINVGSFVEEFKKANGVEDLRDLPGLSNVSEAFKDSDGGWVGLYKLYWCVTYNTKLVDKRDLPGKWEDFLTNPIWRNGNLGLGNRPNLWVANLWLANGEGWTKDFLTRLFTEVNPQLRKEGMNALPQLAAAGEFHAVIPSSYKRAYEMVSGGAPVGFICPEPVPAAPGGSTILLRGAPNPYSAKIYLNWLLSKEGQIAQYLATTSTPIHGDLLRAEFVPFADQILGKKESFSNPTLVRDFMPRLFDYWNGLWLKGGGTPRR